MSRTAIARSARAAALVTALVGAARASDDGSRHPLVPDHAKLQLAGAIGLVSAGPGYAFAGRRLELDLLVGWVPPSIAGVDLVAVTGKLTWLPWSVRLGRTWRARPLTAGLALTYWRAGDRFFALNRDRYPAGYYPLPSAIRGSVAVGGTLGRPAGSLSELALYWEVVAVDLPLAFWLQNPGAVRASDVLSLALGVRAHF